MRVSSATPPQKGADVEAAAIEVEVEDAHHGDAKLALALAREGAAEGHWLTLAIQDPREKVG